MSLDLLNEKMTDICDEVREMSGKTDSLDFDSIINNLDEANSEVEAQADLISQIATALEGKGTGGSVQSVAQAVPVITVSSSGLIEATSTQKAGKVAAGTTVAQKRLDTTGGYAHTVYPTESSQIILSKNIYTTGEITLAPIPSSYIQPQGTRTITSNGTYDVKSYLSVDVQVSGGGGSSVEVYNGSLTAMGPDFLGYTVRYTDEHLNYQEVRPDDSPFNFSVIKNSIIFISGGECSPVSGCYRIGGGYGSYAYIVTDNNFSLKTSL